MAETDLESGQQISAVESRDDFLSDLDNDGVTSKEI